MKRNLEEDSTPGVLGPVAFDDVVEGWGVIPARATGHFADSTCVQRVWVRGLTVYSSKPASGYSPGGSRRGQFHIFTTRDAAFDFLLAELDRIHAKQRANVEKLRGSVQSDAEGK